MAAICPVPRPIPARPLRAAALAIGMAMLGACGGGGGGDDAATTPAAAPVAAPLAAPTDKSTAVDYQYQAVAEARASVETILERDAAALQSLIDGRHADWDRYWTTEYPLLLERLRVASENLKLSENYIHQFVYGLGPVFTKEPADEKIIWEVGAVVLVAVASVYHIYTLYNSGYAESKKAADAQEVAALTAELEQIYVSQGMPPDTARRRAGIDAGQIVTLRATRVGIDHARTVAIDRGLIPGFTSYLNAAGKFVVVSIRNLWKNWPAIEDKVEAIFTTKECRQAVTTKALDGDGYSRHPERSALGPAVAKASTGCMIYFCSTSDGTCPNLPAGEWEAAVFAPDHLRDTDTDVVAGTDGGPVVVQGTLVPVADIGAPPPVAQCSTVQNAGGDQADTRNVPLGATAGTFTLTYEMWGIKDQIQVLYDGGTIFDSGCVSNGKTQLIPYSGLASFVTVQVTPNCSGNTSGTAWNYSLSCPSN